MGDTLGDLSRSGLRVSVALGFEVRGMHSRCKLWLFLGGWVPHASELCGLHCVKFSNQYYARPDDSDDGGKARPVPDFYMHSVHGYGGAVAT